MATKLLTSEADEKRGRPDDRPTSDIGRGSQHGSWVRGQDQSPPLWGM